ncbi:hypothetical protein BTVI_10715 [Pitangus sulphuratus]|nr:hypothetical protein BTVI_10715 [Pitangus sulphuratus]
MDTVLKVLPNQCQVQGKNLFPGPAGHTIPDMGQDAIGLLGHLGTLLALVQPAVNQYPQVPFCLATVQPLFLKPVVAKVQDLSLGLVEPHTVGFSLSIQPVQVPLQSPPTLQKIDTPTQLGVMCKFTNGTLNPLIQCVQVKGLIDTGADVTIFAETDGPKEWSTTKPYIDIKGVGGAQTPLQSVCTLLIEGPEVPSTNAEEPSHRYCWAVLPQGMKNTPSICQRVIADILSPVQQQFPEAIPYHYMDDILLAAESGIFLEESHWNMP